MSLLTEAIQTRGPLIGTLVTVPSPVLAEALSQSGLDWLFFDLEHSVMSLSEIQTMIQAMHPDCLSFIRLEEPLPVYLKKALDTGCSGIVVPQVNSVEIAKAVVHAGKYAPLGNRSLGLGRSVDYGSTLADRIGTENGRSSLIVQIEHKDALECVEEIAALDGIDSLLVGPFDLSSSFGIPGQITDKRVQDGIMRVIAAGKAVNKLVGLFTVTNVTRWRRERDTAVHEAFSQKRSGGSLIGPDGLVKELTKALVERMLAGELNHHLNYEKNEVASYGSGNSRNGKSSKKLEDEAGEMTIAVPRDRNGTFEPQLIEKHQTRFEGFDRDSVDVCAGHDCV